MSLTRVLYGLALTCAASVQAPAAASAETYRVGAGGDFATIAEGLQALADGDVLEIEAGTYRGDGGFVRAADVVVRGVGVRPVIDFDGVSLPGSKGIFVVESSGVIFENLELTGAAVAGDCNGAGIRVEGTDITIRNMLFRGNENGILGTPAAGLRDGYIVIEDSEFVDNGSDCQRGQSHGVYLNSFARATVTGSYFHRSRWGHEYKSRARENFLLYNRFANESGNASREVEITEGGLAVLVGNVIQQSESSDNSTLLGFAIEAQEPPMELYVVHNTFVNERRAGVFIDARGTTGGIALNNLFVGSGSFNGTLGLSSNVMTDAPGFVDSASRDYHLTEVSPAVDGAEEVEWRVGELLLAPAREPLEPVGSSPRVAYGDAADVGAYELAVGEPIEPDGGPSLPDGGALEDAGATVDGGAGDASIPAADAGARADAGPSSSSEMEADGGCSAAGTTPGISCWALVFAVIFRQRRSGRAPA